jgi:EAL domain-containing protein (putative c-di-GMP-specific phosphodiesterase class I)
MNIDPLGQTGTIRGLLGLLLIRTDCRFFYRNNQIEVRTGLNYHVILMGVIYYDIAALFLLAVNLYLFFSRSRLFITQTGVFAALLMISVGSTAMDIAGVVTYWNAARFPVWFLYTINMLFYLFHNTIPLVFTLFILALTSRLDRLKRRHWILLCAPWAVSLGIILPTFTTGIAFTFDTNLRYVRGPGLVALYAIAILYILLSVMMIVINRKRLTRETLLAVLLVLPFSIVPVFVQFFFPELLIQNFGIAVSELFVLLTIQDFGRFTDHSSGLFNSNGLAAQIETLLLKKKPFTVFLIHLDSTGFLQHALGLGLFSELEQEVAKRLFGVSSVDRFAAQTGLAKYAWVLADQGRIPAERERLARFFNAPITVQSKSIYVYAYLCEIRVPQDTKDILRIFQAQQKLSRAHGVYSPNTVLSLGDFSLAATGRRHEVTQAIRKALSGGGFEVHFQPIVCASTGRVVSAEALLRLRTDELGWVSPAEFIPVAEQNGTIHQLGALVCDWSFRFMSGLRRACSSINLIEINLSAAECIQSNLPKRMLALTSKYGLSPGDICFEITETAASFSHSLMIKNLKALVDAGFSIAIDDFGTGYSNVETLMDLPFQTLKIDRSMVGAIKKPHGREALEGIVSMFRNLNINLVAEGVETAEQLDTVTEMGVDLIQGYYFSRPMAEPDFLCFLREKESACI